MKWMPSSPCPVAPQFLQPLNALASKLIGKFNKLMYDSTEDLQMSMMKKCLPAYNQQLQGSKLKKSSGRHLATNRRIIVARCKFLVTTL